VQIGEVLPEIFKRSYPVVQSNTEMLVAVSLLRFHQIDALPLEFNRSDGKKRLAVFGYSCLSKLLKTRPENYGNFLKLPAKTVALELSTVYVNTDLLRLLRVYRKTKFGFAWIESESLGGFAALRDLLELYENETLETNFRLSELASPIFSLPKETEIREVLQEMFNKRIRQIFIRGTNSLVTDRRIISHLFSSSNLEKSSKNPKAFLDVKLSDVDTFEPPRVRGNMTAKKAASLIRDQVDECLVNEKGVVTPWDLIMKPLERGALKIKE